jgi:Elongation factor Tu GTP binding domain
VLVDTPGIGSIHLHNIEVGRASLLEADGAIVVLSADEPLSDEERELLATLAQRRARTFVMVNKADHLDAAELGQVRTFITAKVTDALGEAPDLYCVAARAALEAGQRGLDPRGQAWEWDRFMTTFERFVDVELVDAHLEAARAELGRVGEDLRDAVLIRRAALEFDAAALAERVDQFRSAAAVQQQAFVEDRLLLGHDVDALMVEVADSLAAFAQREPTRWRALCGRECRGGREQPAATGPSNRATDRERDRLATRV